MTERLPRVATVARYHVRAVCVADGGLLIDEDCDLDPVWRSTIATALAVWITTNPSVIEVGPG